MKRQHIPRDCTVSICTAHRSSSQPTAVFVSCRSIIYRYAIFHTSRGRSLGQLCCKLCFLMLALELHRMILIVCEGLSQNAFALSKGTRRPKPEIKLQGRHLRCYVHICVCICTYQRTRAREGSTCTWFENRNCSDSVRQERVTGIV